jgi:hypothetical protein
MLNTVGSFIYTTYRGKMYVWALWEDLFTQNTETYSIPQYVVEINIPTVLNIKYFQVFYKYSHSGQQEVIPSILCK